MKLITVVNAKKTLEAFANKEDIGAHLAYWMTKFVVKAQSEHEFYVNGVNKIIQKYAEKIDDEYVVSKDKIEDLNKEMSSFEETDVEAPDIKFALSELSSELKLSMKQMYTLLDFVDEDK